MIYNRPQNSGKSADTLEAAMLAQGVVLRIIIQKLRALHIAGKRKSVGLLYFARCMKMQ